MMIPVGTLRYRQRPSSQRRFRIDPSCARSRSIRSDLIAEPVIVVSETTLRMVFVRRSSRHRGEAVRWRRSAAVCCCVLSSFRCASPLHDRRTRRLSAARPARPRREQEQRAAHAGSDDLSLIPSLSRCHGLRVQTPLASQPRMMRNAMRVASARTASAMRPAAVVCAAAAPARSASVSVSSVSIAASVRSISTSAAAASTAASSASASAAPLVAPAFGTQSRSDSRFVYIKGVKADGRSKRFYAEVTVAEVATTRGPEFGVQLDGRWIVSPHDHILTAPTRAAAYCIAFEWDSQSDFIRPISMPLTNIAVTALDQSFVDRQRFLSHFRAVMATDSVFLRVDSPSGLVAAQRKHWDPLLAWFKASYGCDLRTTQEIETPTQSPEALAIQRQLLESLNGWQLAALDALTTVTKSFAVSWALLADRLTITAAFEAARVEENFQMRQYGKVEGVYGHGIDMEWTRMSIAAAKTFANMVGPPVEGSSKPAVVHSVAAAEAHEHAHAHAKKH